MTDKMFYIVEALRWGDRENHSYILGLYSDLDRAKSAADAHSEYRGGKYMCQVFQCGMDSEVDSDWSNSIMYQTKETYQIDEDSERVRSILRAISKDKKGQQ